MDNHLPERVRKLIDDQEAASERLIGWVQLAMAVMIGAFYLFSPRPEDVPMIIQEPVPVALAAYGLFTIGRLVLSYQGRIPPWLLVVSIMLDIALLVGLIWSFHVQYDQPASFSLQVPTFIFLFVFIALRALRFDHRFVLLSGLAAAVGWLALFIYAEQAGGAITRNFVDYVNSNAILRGAEVEKVLVILLVTALLTFAIWRARSTLVVAVRESATTEQMSRFLSKGLKDRIAGAEIALEAGEAAERDAAVLMIDIRGFTAYATRHDPRAVVDMLTSYHAQVVPLIEANGGVVDKFLGDGIMATFGAIEPSETAAADALTALEMVLEQSARWREALAGARQAAKLDVNAAVASGRVVFATLGSADRLEYTVIGPAVNLAAKLEKHNKQTNTRSLTTKKTFEEAKRQGFAPRAKVKHYRKERVAGVKAAEELVCLAL